MAKTKQFADSARSRPGLAGAFFIDAVGTGMFLPFSLLFFLTTTSLPLTRIGLALSIAAVVRIPVTIAAGPVCDRFGPRAAIVASQLLQAAGFGGYLLVHGFWSLVAAAVLVQIGNSIFWVAYAPLIFAIAAEGEREHWFALVTTLRTAGLAAGGLIAGATVAVGGGAGFSIGDIIVPAIVTAALRTGAATLWLPMSAVALLDLGAVALLARRIPALTQRVGQAPPAATSQAERLLEADGT